MIEQENIVVIADIADPKNNVAAKWLSPDNHTQVVWYTRPNTNYEFPLRINYACSCEEYIHWHVISGYSDFINFMENLDDTDYDRKIKEFLQTLVKEKA